MEKRARKEKPAALDQMEKKVKTERKEKPVALDQEESAESKDP